MGIGKKITSCSQSFDKITTEEGCTIEGQDACEYMNNYYGLNGELLAKQFNSNWTSSDNAGRFPSSKKHFEIAFIPLQIVKLLVSEIESHQVSKELAQSY